MADTTRVVKLVLEAEEKGTKEVTKGLKNVAEAVKETKKQVEDDVDKLCKDFDKLNTQGFSLSEGAKQIDTGGQKIHKSLQDVLVGASSKMQAWGKKASETGMAMSLAFSTAIAGWGKAAFSSAKIVDDAFDTIKQRTGKTGEDFTALGESFRKVAAEIPAPMEATANALSTLSIRFKLTGKELEEATKKTMEFARVAGTSAESTAVNLSKMMSMMGVKTSEYTNLLDKFAYAATQTGMKVGELTGTIAGYAPILKEFGIGTEEAIGLMTSLEKAGSDASFAMTGLYTASWMLASKGYKDLNQGLLAYQDKIKAATTATEAATLARTVFGRQGVKLAADIRSGAIDFRNLAAATKEAGGTLDRIGKDTLSFSERWIQYKNQMALALQPMGKIIMGLAEKVLPVFTKALKITSDILNALPGPIKYGVVAFLGFGAALGPLLLLAGKVSTAIGGLATMFTNVVAPANAATAAVGAATTATNLLKAAVLAPIVITVVVIGVAAAAKALEKLRDDIEKSRGRFVDDEKKLWSKLTYEVDIVGFIGGIQRAMKDVPTKEFSVALQEIKQSLIDVGWQETTNMVANNKWGTVVARNYLAYLKSLDETRFKLLELKEGQTVVDALTDAMERGAEQTKVYSVEAQQLSKSWGLLTMEEATKKVGEMTEALAMINDQGLNTQEVLKLMGPGFASLYQRMKPYLDAYKIAAPEIRKFGEAAVAYVATANKAADSTSNLASKILASGEAIKVVVGQVEGLGKAFSEFNANLDSSLTQSSKDFIANTQDTMEAHKKLWWNLTHTQESELTKQRRQNQEYWEGIRKGYRQQRDAMVKAYEDQKKVVNDYYDNQKQQFVDFVEAKKRELDVVAKVETAKVEIIKDPASAQAIIDKAKADLDVQKAAGEKSIEAAREEALKKVEAYKEGLDKNVSALSLMIDQTYEMERKAFENILTGIQEVAEQGSVKVTTALGIISTSLLGLMDMFGQKAADTRATITDTMTAAQKAAIEATATQQEQVGLLMGSLAQLGQAFATYFAEVKKGGKESAEALESMLAAAAGSVGGAVGGLISGKKSNYAGTGSAIGGALGSIIPGVGTILGSAVGGLLGGLFGKKEKKTEEQRQAEQFKNQMDEAVKAMSKYGKISEATAQAIAEDRKTMTGAAAEAKNFASVIADVGVNQKNLNDLWKGATGILDQYKQGNLDSATASKALGGSFVQLLDGARKFGTEGSAAMVQFIKEVKASGVEVQEVTDYIQGMLGVTKKGMMNAAQGLEAMAAKGLGALYEQAEATAQTIADKMQLLHDHGMENLPIYAQLEKELKQIEETGYLAKGSIAETLNVEATILEEMFKGSIKSIDEEMKALEDSGKKYTTEWDRLRKEKEKLNEQYEKEKSKLKPIPIVMPEPKVDIEKLKKETKRIESQFLATFEAMKASGASLPDIFESLGPALDTLNARYKMTGDKASGAIGEMLKIRNVTVAHQDLFDAIDGNLAVLGALGSTGSLTQKSFNDAALGAQDYYKELQDAGLNGKQALSQMAPTLEKLRFLAKEQGFAIDETTQSMIDQAEQQGLLKKEEMSVQDTMMAGFGELIKAIGGDVPKAFQEAMGRINANFQTIDGATTQFQENLQEAATNAETMGEVADEALEGIATEAEEAAAQVGELESAIYGSGVVSALDTLKDRIPGSVTYLGEEADKAALAQKELEASTKLVGLAVVGFKGEADKAYKEMGEKAVVAFDKVGDTVSKKTTLAKGQLKDAFSPTILVGLQGSVTSLEGSLKDLGTGAKDSLKDVVSTGLIPITDGFGSLTDSVKGTEDSIVKLVKEMDKLEAANPTITVRQEQDEGIPAARGGTWFVGKPTQKFIAHKGETVQIGTGGSGPGMDVQILADKLNELIVATKEGKVVAMEPIVLEDSASKKTIEYVKKQLDSSNWKIPAGTIGG